MVVQHNLTAMNSNRMLGITSKAQAKSTEKLSSGYKINRAADDAAGLSISEKMRKQIRGLTQASANAEDGISTVQTAEGALNEVQDMLQRMNELAVKAANGTMSENDRNYIQSEVNQLVTEIDRVATTTKFNETYLLKGNNKGSVGYLTYGTAKDGNLAAAKFITGKTLDVNTGTLSATFKEITTAVSFQANTVNGQEINNTNVKMSTIDIGNTTYVLVNSTESKDGKNSYSNVSKVVDEINKANKTAVTLFANNAGAKTAKAYASMDELLADIKDDFATDIKNISSYVDDKTTTPDKKGDGKLTLKVEAFADQNSAADISLHVGADSTSDNKITMNIAHMSARGLGVNGIKVNGESADNATKAIDTIANAIQMVSSQRSALGAVQNRLEHTIANLDNVVENTTAAESQIRDTDMATEMVKYSNNNILAQAGQAMLAQANQANQGVLSLLG